MKRAPATLFAAFLHFDVSFMIWVILRPLVSVLRATTGTFANGLLLFGALSLTGAILVTIVGRTWRATFISESGPETLTHYALVEG